MFSSPGHPHRQKNSTSVAFARHKSRDCVVRGQFFFTPRRFGLFSRGFILWESVAWRNMRPAAWDRLNKMQCAAYLFRCIRHRSQLFFCDMFSREGIRWRRHVFVQLVSHCPASRFCFHATPAVARKRCLNGTLFCGPCFVERSAWQPALDKELKVIKFSTTRVLFFLTKRSK